MTKRVPDQTRTRLLEAAFDEIHHSGYHAAGLDAILAKAAVTKGALYHHFANKEEMALTVIDEVLGRYVRERWIHPLEESDAPFDTLIQLVRATVSDLPEEFVRLGCPLNNLNQEMSGRSDAFREHVAVLYREWKETLAASIRRGQEQGQVRQDVDSEALATLIVSLNQGLAGQMKNAASTDVIESVLPLLEQFLETLRTNPTRV